MIYRSITHFPSALTSKPNPRLFSFATSRTQRRDASKETQQDRSDSERQRGTDRIKKTPQIQPNPKTLFIHSPTPQPIHKQRLLQITTNRPPLRVTDSMEVEVKLKLPDSNTHQKLSSLLSSHHIKTHLQENFFFDGSNSELSSSRAVLRIRFYDGNARCVVTFKAKAVIVDGVSRVEEIEEEIDVLVGRACVSDPWRLSSVECGVIKRVLKEYEVKEGFVCLGSFKNVRKVYEWKKGLVLELDETQYEFGRNYEIECEITEDPEMVKKLLEEFLKENGIKYEYSKNSKFSVFRMGKLPN